MSGQVKCLSCAHIYTNPSAKFCEECGTKRPAPPPEGSTFCTSCGTKLRAEQKFCHSCGEKTIQFQSSSSSSPSSSPYGGPAASKIDAVVESERPPTLPPRNDPISRTTTTTEIKVTTTTTIPIPPAQPGLTKPRMIPVQRGVRPQQTVPSPYSRSPSSPGVFSRSGSSSPATPSRNELDSLSSTLKGLSLDTSSSTSSPPPPRPLPTSKRALMSRQKSSPDLNKKHNAPLKYSASPPSSPSRLATPLPRFGSASPPGNAGAPPIPRRPTVSPPVSPRESSTPSRIGARPLALSSPAIPREPPGSPPVPTRPRLQTTSSLPDGLNRSRERKETINVSLKPSKLLKASSAFLGDAKQKMAGKEDAPESPADKERKEREQAERERKKKEESKKKEAEEARYVKDRQEQHLQKLKNGQWKPRKSSIYVHSAKDHDICRFELTGSTLQKHGKKKQFVTYTIEVLWGDCFWRIHRRYSQFDAFDKMIRKTTRIQLNVPLPGKSMLGTAEDGVVEGREQALAEYVKGLVRQQLEFLNNEKYEQMFIRFFAPYQLGDERESCPKLPFKVKLKG